MSKRGGTIILFSFVVVFGGYLFVTRAILWHNPAPLFNPNFALGSRNSSNDAGLFLPKKGSTVGNATLSLFSSKNSRPRSPRFSRPNAKVGLKKKKTTTLLFNNVIVFPVVCLLCITKSHRPPQIIHKFLLPIGEKVRMRGNPSKTEPLLPLTLIPYKSPTIISDLCIITSYFERSISVWNVLAYLLIHSNAASRPERTRPSFSCTSFL